jgi:uncharacterized protein (TIGR03437 family)
MRRYAFLLITTAALAWAQLPNILPGGIVNGASFAPNQPISVGSLISVFGTNLSTSLQHADTVPLSKSLGGVTVEFVNGDTRIPAPMLDTIPPANQLNVQVPWGIVPPNAPAQSVNVVVTVAGVGSSQPAPVIVGPFSPGIFSTGPPAFRAIVQSNLDGTLAQPSGSIPGLTTHPARHGDVLIIYATGLGAVDNPPPDGAAAGTQFLIHTLNTPTVLMGGITAPLIYSLLSPQFVGVNQLAVTVPDSAPTGDAVSLQIQMGGVTSPSNVTMAISQ